MKVYVVFHDDIEDSKWVRGVFVTRQLADEMVQRGDPCPNGHVHRRHVNGTLVAADAMTCQSANDHFTGSGESLCCGVHEWDAP